MMLRPVLLALSVALCPVCSAFGQIAINSVTTQLSNTAAPQVRTGIVGATPGNIEYSGQELQLTSVTTGTGTYVPLLTGTVTAIRNSAAESFSGFSNVNQSPTFNRFTGTGTSSEPLPRPVRQVSGQYFNNYDQLFASNNLWTGAENLLVNTGNATSAFSNIERLDYVFSDPISTSADLGFAIFERGNNNTAGNGGNATFKVAAIVGFDGLGNPLFSSTILTVTQSSYGLSLTSYNYDVFGEVLVAAETELNQQTNPDLGPQGVGGVFIPTSAFSSSSATIRGYTIFGVDASSPSTFLTDSGSGNDADLVSSGAFLFINATAIPEPGSMALLALGVMGVMGHIWRRRSLAAA